VTSLVNGTTRIRSWYASPSSWRFDVLTAGAERDVYGTTGGEYVWDYGANLLTELIGAQPVRLLRAGDLLPPDLARRVLSVEFHGYHSQDWAALPVTLPSQWYGFNLVARAIQRGAIIVVLRGGKDWDVAIPGLHGYPRRFSTNTVRSASVSPGNLPQGVFDLVIDAIQRWRRFSS